MTSIPTRKIEMKTVQQMLDLKPTTLCPALYKWSIKAAAMIRTQAAEIEALTKMLVISDDTHQTWMKANAPRGWIDDLRIERDALKQQAQIHAMEAKTANSTIYEIYQVVSGGTGEPGNWNGARPVREAFDALKADAERYRWLKDNRSYAYAMQPDSPAECGIEFQWQQCSYEERNWNIDSAIDDEISRAAIDAMKGTT